MGDGHLVLGGDDAPLGLEVGGHESDAITEQLGTLEEVGLGGLVRQKRGQRRFDLAAVVAVLISEDDPEEGAGGVDVVEGGVAGHHLLGKLGIDPGGFVDLGQLAGGAGLRVGLAAAGIADHAAGLDFGEIVLGAGRRFGEFGLADLGFHVGHHDGGILGRRWWYGSRRRRRRGRSAEHDHGLGGQRLHLVMHARLLGLHGEIGRAKGEKDEDEKFVQHRQTLPKVDDLAAAADGLGLFAPHAQVRRGAPGLATLETSKAAVRDAAYDRAKDDSQQRAGLPRSGSHQPADRTADAEGASTAALIRGMRLPILLVLRVRLEA